MASNLDFLLSMDMVPFESIPRVYSDLMRFKETYTFQEGTTVVVKVFDEGLYTVQGFRDIKDPEPIYEFNLESQDLEQPLQEGRLVKTDVYTYLKDLTLDERLLLKHDVGALLQLPVAGNNTKYRAITIRRNQQAEIIYDVREVGILNNHPIVGEETADPKVYTQGMVKLELSDSRSR